MANIGEVNFIPPADYVGTADCGIPAVNDFFMLDVDGLPGGSFSRYAPCVAPFSAVYTEVKVCPINRTSDQIILAAHNSTVLYHSTDNLATYAYLGIVKFPLTQIQYDSNPV